VDRGVSALAERILLIVAEFREGGSTMRVYQQLGWTGSFTRPHRSACLGRLGRRSTLTAFIRTAMLASEVRLSGF
jgi:hypothetical protein